MKIWNIVWLRWFITPFAWLGGYALGQCAWAGLEHLIASMPALPMAAFFQWLGGGVCVYMGATCSTQFASFCAPKHKQITRWAALSLVLLLNILYACSIPQMERTGNASKYCFNIGMAFAVMGWLFYREWQEFIHGDPKDKVR